MSKTISIDDIKARYRTFLEEQKTLVLSSLDDCGHPFTSYAPFVKQDGKLYIYLSKITEHYRHLELRPQVSVMLIADEAKTRNLFARERARFACSVTKVADENHEDVFAAFESVHGKAMMDVLRNLDLSLFALEPSAGRYVVGFGQAFDIDLDATYCHHVVIDSSNQNS